MIHKVLTTNFYHNLVKQLYLILSLDNLSFVPSVTTSQNWNLLLVPQILFSTSVTLAHRSEFEVLFEQAAGLTNFLTAILFTVPRNGSALSRYQRWWSQPCCHLPPCWGFVNFSLECFPSFEFTPSFNSSQPKYLPKLLIELLAVLAYYFYLIPSVINIDIDTLL